MQDTEIGDFEHDDAPISEAEIERIQRQNSPRTMGVMLTVFVALLVIMIGGLSAYYYYNIRQQGSTHEQTIRDNWDEIVVASTDLTNALAKVADFNALFDKTSGSFQRTLDASNGALKDVSYNLQSISGYAFSGNMVVGKMTAFVETYLDYLRELQSVIEQGRNGLIEDIKELDKLVELDQDMNDAYAKLLVADKTKVIASVLPPELFQISTKTKELIEKYLEDKKTKGETDDAEKTAAGAVANKFMQAYMDKDADSMLMYLTEQAKSEFNRGIVEDATEIKSFEITDTRKISDTRMEIDARIKQETPGAVTQTEKRKFVLLKKDNVWGIDSFKVV